jgi:hypothetical protein
MYIRRYYPRGSKFKRSYTNDFFAKMVADNGIEFALRVDNASYEIIFESRKEQKEYLQECYNRVLADVRWYLDRLDELPTFNSSGRVYDKHINCFTTEGAEVKSQN